jgi:uncharacterized protein YbjT (DUF2867 family)
MYAIILGSTGAVGGQLLKQILADDDYQTIITPIRNPQASTDQKIILADIIEIDSWQKLIKPDSNKIDVFCCLGSTIKKAGSQQAFAKIDFDLVVSIGRWAKDKGVNSFHVISSLGADAESNNFYLATKGKTEQALAALVFPALFIYRPSLLYSAKRKEFRLGELVALAALYPMKWLPFKSCQRIAPVKVEQVANAMLQNANSDKAGCKKLNQNKLDHLTLSKIYIYN